MGRDDDELQVFMYKVELLDGDNAVVVEVPDKTMVINSAVTQTTVLDLGKSWYFLFFELFCRLGVVYCLQFKN